jgi:hypothetical protein
MSWASTNLALFVLFLLYNPTYCWHNQLLSAITDAWTVVVIVYSVLSDDNGNSWTIGGTSNDVIATTVVMHTTLFLSVLTTQVCAYALYPHVA